MTKTTAVNHTYRTILGNIVCERYTDRDAALVAIEKAFETRKLNVREMRDLESRVG